MASLVNDTSSASTTNTSVESIARVFENHAFFIQPKETGPTGISWDNGLGVVAAVGAEEEWHFNAQLWRIVVRGATRGDAFMFSSYTITEWTGTNIERNKSRGYNLTPVPLDAPKLAMCLYDYVKSVARQIELIYEQDASTSGRHIPFGVGNPDLLIHSALSERAQTCKSNH